MALTLERIREIVGNEGYRLVEDRLGSDRGSDAPQAQVAEARSSRIEVLQRTYGKTVSSNEGSGSDSGSQATRGSSGTTTGTATGMGTTTGTGMGTATGTTMGTATGMGTGTGTATGAIVTVEPSHGHGRRKAIVLSEDGEILGEQG